MFQSQFRVSIARLNIWSSSDMIITTRMKLAPLALGLCLAASAISMTSPASAAPAGNLGASAALKNELVQDVQWRRHGYYGPYRGGGRYYGYRGGGAVAAGVIGGLALGAALGAAAAPPPPPVAYYEPDYAPDYAPGYAEGGDWLAYCSSKYRSFDPRSGTYLGYDGLRHPCQ
jgi:hypothetical protein